MQVYWGIPRLTSVNKQQRLYCGLTSHQPAHSNTVSKNMIVVVAVQVLLSQLSQFYALTGNELSSIVQLRNPIFLSVSFCDVVYEARLVKQHQQLFPNVQFAIWTASLIELIVVDELQQEVLRQAGYFIRKASRTIKTTKQTSIVTEYTITNLFLFLISPKMPDRLDRIIITEVVIKVAMNAFLKSGRICAVTEDIIKAQTKTQSSMMPRKRVTTIPTEIRVFSQYTDKNINIIFNHKQIQQSHSLLTTLQYKLNINNSYQL